MIEDIGTVVEFGEYTNGLLVRKMLGIVVESETLSISVLENNDEYSLLGGQYEVVKDEDLINIREVSNKLNMQNQYVMYYLKGLGSSYPDFSDGIRYLDNDNYHQIKIHKDDVEIFIKRVKEHRIGGFY